MTYKRILSFILVFVLLGSYCTFAEEKTEVSELAVFSVEERNGAEVEGFLAKRGIPLPDGALSPNDEVILENVKTGEIVTPQTKVLEKYQNGSVSWLMVAVSVDLKPYENISFVLKKGKGNENTISCFEKDGRIYVDNGLINIIFDWTGIAELKFRNEDVFNEKAEQSFCSTADETYTTTTGKVEILEAGGEFVRIKASAPYGDSPMRTEKTYTITKGSSRIAVTNGYISYNSEGLTKDSVCRFDYINSLYESYSLNAGFNDIRSGSGQKSNVTGIQSGDYITAYNSETDTSVSVVSKDVEKFRGAVSPTVVNGFMHKDNSLIFAPILYGIDYTWQDGLSRTIHSDIIIKDGVHTELSQAVLLQKSPPAVTVNKEVYLRSGVLKSDKMSALAQSQIEELIWTKDKRGGRIDAGTIPFALDSEAEFMGMHEIHLAEIDYNTWYGVMNSGNPDLFDVVRDSTEAYADVMLYKGSVTGARGLGRYRFGIGTTNSGGSHPYYSEFSSLYIAYLMTGDEYFYDSCYSAADAWCRLAESAGKMSGHTMISTSGWENGMISINRDVRQEEIRAAFQIRSMYNAYKLFGEERFLNLAKEIGRWSAALQEEDGSWAQGFNQSGERIPNTHGITGITSWIMYKNYIMLYTQRGHCDYFRQTGDKEVFDQIQKFADYLINELGEQDWMWDPCGDKDKCETGEDYSRGKSPFQEMMSAEVFATVYNETKEDKYLNALSRVLSNYIATAKKTGFVAHRYNAKEYLEGMISPISSGQNTTLLHIDSMLCKIFTENRQKVIDMGYEGVAAIFADGAEFVPEEITSKYIANEVGANLYRKEDQRYLFVSNNSGYLSGEWKKDIELKVAGESSLWTEFECEIDNLFEVKLKKTFDMFDYAYSKELPIKLCRQTGTVNATVVSYNKDEIVFDVKGEGKAEFKIGDGDFAIRPENRYTITVSDGRTKRITVKKGGGLKPKSGELYIRLDLSETGDVFTDTVSHWSREDVLKMYNEGVVKGTGNGLFSPEREITRKEAILFAMRTLGISDDNAEAEARAKGIIGDENLNQPATRAEVIRYYVTALESVKGKNIQNRNLTVDIYNFAGKIIDDETAVNADADSIVFGTQVLTTNITLPRTGKYGSEITWSGGSKYLSPDGVVTRPDGNQESQTAVLTAEIRRGDSCVTKEFTFTVESVYEDRYNSGSFGDCDVLINRVKGEFDFKLCATPLAPCDWVLGFHDDSLMPSAYSQMPMIIRFNPNGKIDAYSENMYKAETDIAYNPGETYTFEISGSTVTKKYSAVAVDEKGVRYQIAKDYSFRTSAISASNSFDGISLVASKGEGYVSKLEIAKGSNAGGEYGLKAAEEYFGITNGGVKIDGGEDFTFFSTAPEVLSPKGELVKAPDSDVSVYIIGLRNNINVFNDIDAVEKRLYKEVFTAQALGLVKGNEGNMLKPDEICKRAEVITIARRLYDLLAAEKL